MSDDAVGVAPSQSSIPCSSTMENIENLLAEMEPNYRRKDDNEESKTKHATTQVDIRAWVSVSEINKETSPEVFWQKLAEQSKAALEEARDENRKLHITIDYIARENIRYQHIIDTHERKKKDEENQVVEELDGMDYPLLDHNEGGAEVASALYFAQRDSETSCSL